MMEISIDEIKTYLNCPTQYHFRHAAGLPEDDLETVGYSRALHRTVQYMYFSMMGGFIPSNKQMKDKWSKIWNEEQDIQFDFTNDFLQEHLAENLNFRGGREQQLKKKTVKGYEMIHNFYHYNKDRLGVPIAVDQEFRVPIGGVTVTGKFELIRESLDKDGNNRFIDIVDFKTGSYNGDDFLTDNDLVMSIMSYAFRNLFQSEEDRLVYSYIGTGKEIYTVRGEKQYRRMEAIVESVAEGIMKKRFYPRESFMCRHCPFKSECAAKEF